MREIDTVLVPLIPTLAEDARYIREKLDKLDEKVDAFQLSSENRISKLEARAGWFGAIGGVIGAVGAYFASGFHKP